MALTKVTGKGITCSAVTEDKLGTSAVTTNKINNDAVTSAKIQDGQVTADDLASTLDLSSKTVTLPGSATSAIDQNIALLGFKMAVNDGLTVFNLVDGVVDEFNDESGTDEAEGSNDTYCGTSDYYINGTTFSISAGFTTSSVTEPDTSTAGTNPDWVCGSYGSFTVPTGATSINVYAWGAGGGRGNRPTTNQNAGGGGGGFSSGVLATSACTSYTVVVGEAGKGGPVNSTYVGRGRGLGSAGGGSGCSGGSGLGGGMAGLFTCTVNSTPIDLTGYSAPAAIVIAGGGGGGGYQSQTSITPGATTGVAGAGGGPQGQRGDRVELGDGSYGSAAGGGTQTTGGQGGDGAPGGCAPGNPGVLFGGGAGLPGDGNVGPGGGGYYGGGGAGSGSVYAGYDRRVGGGGSGYVSHPQITCGTSEAGNACEGGGTADPNYVASTNEGTASTGSGADGEDGYVLITASGIGGAASTTIISTAFTSSSVATSARIVVFEENVDTPTLNTDIIASVSRDAGVTFTNTTLTDSGYVTGSSGQRILTGQADISGQPSGQSMRWKLALANNQVKIHGVALQWS